MLFKLLAAPFLAPLQFVEFIGGAVENAVQAQIHDAEAIKGELAALEKRLDAGELSEEEFETLELVLVKRLQAASKRMAAEARK
jgi:hypothetical protein